MKFSIKDFFSKCDQIRSVRTDKSVFYLPIMQSFLNFPSILRIRSAERIRGIGGNF